MSVNEKIKYKQDYKADKNNNKLSWFDETTNLMWEVKTQETKNIMYFRSLENFVNLPEKHYQENNIPTDHYIKDAETYAKHLNEINYCGFNDWRLPTINELQSLFNKDEQTIKTSGIGESMAAYWSSTTKDQRAFIFDFNKGCIGLYPLDYLLWVRCVRGVPPTLLSINLCSDDKMLFNNAATQLSEILKTKTNVMQFVFNKKYLDKLSIELAEINNEIQIEASRNLDQIALALNAFPHTKLYRHIRNRTFNELIIQWGLWHI